MNCKIDCHVILNPSKKMRLNGNAINDVFGKINDRCLENNPETFICVFGPDDSDKNSVLAVEADNPESLRMFEENAKTYGRVLFSCRSPERVKRFVRLISDTTNVELKIAASDLQLN